jgi:DNA repair exonuclease SbcCD ATPase subunit
LHGVRFSPTVIIALFDDDDIIIKRAEGEDEIKVALRIGAFEQIIKEFIDKRMKLKLAERLAEEFAGAVASDIARKKASLEYEQKLKKEKEDIEKKEKERQEQNQKALENERIKRIDAEKKAEEARQKEQKAKLKAYVIDDLLSMDLKKAKVAEIKEKMADLGISSAGCFTRDALISVLKDNIPVLKTKLQQENPSQSYSGSTTPSSYISSNRHLLFDEQVDSSHSDNKLSTDKANARIKSLEENIDDLDQKRVSLEEKNSQLEKQLKINNALLEKKDQEIMDLKQKSVSFLRRSQDHPDTQGKIKELENELIETRLLYACTVDDLDIVS